MSVGGDDDTVAGSLPIGNGSSPSLAESELVGGRYKIVRWLGGGGMGRVYEALDTELDERVALKVLRSGLSNDAIERFRREVKLTRRIQHRNVARMFDIGEHRGEKFLTMELVDGEPLTRQMGEQPLPWPKLEAYATQICAGLAAAHAAGVIHRDLKPDNVLIERGTERAVLTDFGIARSGDDVSVTQVGAVVGTPRYMAPEQLAGREVDARADLFSLGVMLFELATATRPWPGDNAIAIAVSQATTAPRSLESVTGAIPAYFASIVAACLQLDPADRPASAAAIVEALAEAPPLAGLRDGASGNVRSGAPPRAKQPVNAPRIPSTAPATEPTALAVLPVACAPGDEYLADGLFEDLTDTLSTTPGLRVRPAGIVRSAATPDPREVGQRLHVDHVVTTSLRRVPNGLRITTRLIGVSDGFQIWAHKTDCTEAAVLEVADALAHGIAEALSTRATSDTKPTDPRAVELYLRARAELRRFWGSHAQTAADLLEQAVQSAPTSPPILGASAYANVQAWVMRSDPSLLPRVRAALERGLATGHGEAYLGSAQFHFNCGEDERAATDLARALARSPMSAQTHELTAKILLEIEGPAQARLHYETARGLDPGRSQIIDNDLARADALEQKWTDADERVERLLVDSDVAIQQLGFMTRSRLACWRDHKDVLLHSSKDFIERVSTNAGAILRFVADVTKRGKIDPPLFDEVVTYVPDADMPLRQHLIRMQVFCEIAIVFDEHALALRALGRAAELGLLDVTWLDHCPLLGRIAEYPEFAAHRRIVADRAARVLAAFRSQTTTA